MAFKFTTAKDAAKGNGVKVLVYGPAGIGKTVLVSTAPNPMLFSAESGLLSLRAKNDHVKIDVPVAEIATVEDLQEAYKWASKSKEADKYDTICLDSISEIADVVLSNARAQVSDMRQAYGELQDKMLLTMKLFRDLKGKNVYFAARQGSNKDDKSGLISYFPDMPGNNLKTAVPYLFDELFHMRSAKDDKGNVWRFLKTQPDLQYQAKDRSGVLKDKEEPNLTKIFNKILK